MVVYCLANQSAGIPLDNGREPGRPEGLVEFAPANDAVIGGELYKVVVAPSGITGQRFDPLDFHRSKLSLRAGSLATASRSLFLSTQPPSLCMRIRRLLLGGRSCFASRARATWPTPGQCPGEASVRVETLGPAHGPHP